MNSRKHPPGVSRLPQDAPVLVCGLGAFGQAVLRRLLRFDVPLRLLDQRPPDWRSPELRDALCGQLSLGDMRRPQALLQAGCAQARSVLLLASDSGVNIEAALQVRLLNDDAEIVVRSGSELDHLGTLLEERLPRLRVVNPVLLSAGALVQSLRPGRRLGRFEVAGDCFEMAEGPLLDQRFQRSVQLEEGGAGLVVMPVAFTSPQAARQTGSRRTPFGWAPPRLLQRAWSSLRRSLRWGRQRSRLQLGLISLLLLMALAGIPLFATQGGWVQGVFVMTALLKGDYVDPTNVVLQGQGPADRDAPLVLTTLLYSLVGTLLSSALVALILDQLLMARFGLRRRRRLKRTDQPILLIGGGHLATSVARMLQRERHVVVRVEADGAAAAADPDSVFFASLETALDALRWRTVGAVGLLGGHLLADLRDLLQLQMIWPEARFALLARSEGPGARLADLLGGADLISPIELSADVVVATAFGERVEGIWRIREQNLLQVRYTLSAEDTLVGHTLSRIDHGYGLTVVSLLRARQSSAQAFPPPGTVVGEGDQLVVLAGLAALRRVELGRIRPPGCSLTLQLPDGLEPERLLLLRQSLGRHLGLDPAAASALLQAAGAATIAVDPDCGALLARDLRHQGLSVALACDPATAPVPAAAD